MFTINLFLLHSRYYTAGHGRIQAPASFWQAGLIKQEGWLPPTKRASAAKIN